MRETIEMVKQDRAFHQKQHAILDLALMASLADEWKHVGRASDDCGTYTVKYAFPQRADGGIVLITYKSTTQPNQSDSHTVRYLCEEYANVQQRMGISEYYGTLGHLIERAYVAAQKECRAA